MFSFSKNITKIDNVTNVEVNFIYVCFDWNFDNPTTQFINLKYQNIFLSLWSLFVRGNDLFVTKLKTKNVSFGNAINKFQHQKESFTNLLFPIKLFEFRTSLNYYGKIKSKFPFSTQIIIAPNQFQWKFTECISIKYISYIPYASLFVTWLLNSLNCEHYLLFNYSNNKYQSIIIFM